MHWISLSNVLTLMNKDPKRDKNEDWDINSQQLTPVIRILLVVAVLISVLSLFIAPSYSLQPSLTARIIFVLILTYVVLLLILRTERARSVGLFFLFVTWFALTLSAAVLMGGFNTAFLDAYVLIIAIAGLLFGSEIGYTFATLSILSVVGFFLVGKAGWLEEQWGLPASEFVTSVRLVYLLVAYVLIYLIARSITAAAARVRANKLALEQSNIELHAIQSALEQHVSERSTEILRQSQYFKALVDNIPIAVVTLDLNNQITACNPAFENLFQYSREEVVKKRLDKLITDENTQADAENHTRKMISGEVVRYKSVRFRKDRTPVDVEVYGVPVIVAHQQVGVLVLYQDITELKRAEDFLQYIASHDSLTGLPNRMLFIDRLNHALQKASRSGVGLAVAFLDLDNFKTVNDTYGHEKGDFVLKKVAQRLQSGLRASDTIARMGGDEFTFIFETIVDSADALHLARKITATLTEPFQLDDDQVVLTASIGISLFPGDGDDAAALLRRADKAMYASKMLTENSCQLYAADQPLLFPEQPVSTEK